MPCYHPIVAFKSRSGGICFSKQKTDGNEILLSCGQCVGCRLEKSRQWATRIMHEAQLHKENSFLTLTYRDDALPAGRSLEYKPFQNFMKLLRKTHPVRFFMCGEYGEQNGRPHYHAIIFGHAWREDRYAWKKTNGGQLYRSPRLEQQWHHGDSTIGDVTFETAAYCARYAMKKITGDAAKKHYEVINPNTGEIINKKPEFCNMSRNPGIGTNWVRLYWQEILKGKVVINGHEATIPRFYKKRLSGLKYINEEINMEAELNTQKGENTDERLKVREQVALARTSLNKRNAI